MIDTILTSFMIMGHFRQLRECAVDGVHGNHDHLPAIGKNECWDFQHAVVAACLVADALRYRHFGTLALHDDLRRTGGVVDHDVASARHAVEGYRALHLHQLVGVAVGGVQHADGLLAHAFLGGQGHVASPHGVEHLSIRCLPRRHRRRRRWVCVADAGRC